MEKSGIMHLSTACISKETAGELNEAAFHNELAFACVPIYEKSVYGWFLQVPINDKRIEEKLPKDIRECFALARKNECEWLVFDRDVKYDKKDRLKEYSW